MRQIKFRLWNSKLNEMWRNFSIDDEGHIVLEAEDGEYQHFKPGDESGLYLMQFTGLLDKNSKEIWEGDVVDFYFSENDTADHLIGVVEYGNWADRSGYQVYDRNSQIAMSLGNKFFIKVIGNIYSNPELLK